MFIEGKLFMVTSPGFSPDVVYYPRLRPRFASHRECLRGYGHGNTFPLRG